MDFQLSLATESAKSAYPDEPVAVRTGVSIAHVVQLMQNQRVGAVIVCNDDEHLAGVFTERDALRLMADGADLNASIETQMSAPPVSLTATSSMASAIETMSNGGYRHLPLVSADKPTDAVGMIDVKGIVRYLVEHFPNTIYTLPPTPERSTPEREGA
ncbi:MAG: CBS domain-containing protein [Planctomycetota bacterium]